MLAASVFVWRSLSSGVEQAAKDQASEVIKEINRKAALDRELEQRRGTERQGQRFVSYGRLWAEMRPLYLWDLAQGQDVQDPYTRECLVDALAWAADLLTEGASPTAIAARITVGDSDTLLTKRGLHLLTGRVGKGQQFDWVIIIGLEDGCLPDFRATSASELAEETRVLSVMISRARHGVVLSSAQEVPDLSGRARQREPSRLLAHFSAVDACKDRQGLIQWLKTVDWDAIASRTG